MEIKYIVDQVVGNTVVLENVESGRIIFLSLSNLGFSVNDGDVLVFNDGVLSKSEEEKEKRTELIKEKFNKVRRKK